MAMQSFAKPVWDVKRQYYTTLQFVLPKPASENEGEVEICPITLDAIAEPDLAMKMCGMSLSSVLSEHPMLQVVQLPCKHRFNGLALVCHWLQTRMKCPVCTAGTDMPMDVASFSSEPWAVEQNKRILRSLRYEMITSIRDEESSIASMFEGGLELRVFSARLVPSRVVQHVPATGSSADDQRGLGVQPLPSAQEITIHAPRAQGVQVSPAGALELSMEPPAPPAREAPQAETSAFVAQSVSAGEGLRSFGSVIAHIERVLTVHTGIMVAIYFYNAPVLETVAEPMPVVSFTASMRVLDSHPNAIGMRVPYAVLPSQLRQISRWIEENRPSSMRLSAFTHTIICTTGELASTPRIDMADVFNGDESCLIHGETSDEIVFELGCACQMTDEGPTSRSSLATLLYFHKGMDIED